jgi:hypothetical protein
LEESKKGSGKEDPPAVTGAEKGDQEPAVDAPEGSPNPDQVAEPSTQEPSVERVKGLLKAYQETLDAIEELPAVVWVPWDLKGPGRYFKVPYLRWFLAYFVEYHIGRSLNTLDRRLNAIAALSDDPDASWPKREMVKLYLQSLPRPPYSVLIFAAVLVALVIALPLHAFGNVFYVLDIVGALLWFNVGYLGRALEGNHLGPTVRSVIVLLVGLTVVAAVLTSPFGLKRMLFNLHPWSRERLGSTAARSHGYRAEGLYALEDGVFGEAGIRRPKEGRWDLVFQTFLLSLLLVIGLCMAGLSLVILMSWNIHIQMQTRSSAHVYFFLPEVS